MHIYHTKGGSIWDAVIKNEEFILTAHEDGLLRLFFIENDRIEFRTDVKNFNSYIYFITLYVAW